MPLIGHWLRAGVDLVFPPTCAACEASLEDSQLGLLCETCRSELADNQPACQRCGVPALGDSCRHCAGQRLHFQGVVRLGIYERQLRSAVLHIKRRERQALAMALGALLAREGHEQLAEWKLDAVVPVPMHWSRRLWRGANSPSTIARRLASDLKIPTADHLLVRHRRTAPQAQLSPSKRLANVRGAFRAVPHRDLPGSRLLVVDDIMTTGATVNEAAKELVRAGAEFVAVAVLARATHPV
jgi:ComF family protein